MYLMGDCHLPKIDCVDRLYVSLCFVWNRQTIIQINTIAFLKLYAYIVKGVQNIANSQNIMGEPT